MRVDMTFDQQKVEQQGYTLAAVRQTVQKNFAAHGLHCVQNGPVLSCADCGVWQDDNGAQEDLLAQAGKLQGWKVT